MAFLYNNTHTHSAADTANPRETTHTCAAGSKLLVLAIHTGTNTARTGTGPTYNGNAMTQVGSTIIGSGECTTELWYLINPTVGGALTISMGNTATPKASIALTVFDFTGDATDAAALWVNASNPTTSNTSAQNPSLTINSTPAGCIVVEALGSGYADEPSGQTHTRVGSAATDWDEGNWSNACQYTVSAGGGNITLIKEKMQRLCESTGVQLTINSCIYRSQRCSCCGWVQKKNRKLKEFLCLEWEKILFFYIQ